MADPKGLSGKVDLITGAARLRGIGRAIALRLADAVKSEFGRLDIIVNNAGVLSNAGSSPSLDTDEDVWYETMDVNVNGVFLVTKVAELTAVVAFMCSSDASYVTGQTINVDGGARLD